MAVDLYNLWGKEQYKKNQYLSHNCVHSYTYKSCCSLEFINNLLLFRLKPYYPKYSDRQALVNSVDSDQTPQNAASDQGVYCLPLIQQL